jgi:hypothetical protein
MGKSPEGCVTMNDSTTVGSDVVVETVEVVVAESAAPVTRQRQKIDASNEVILSVYKRHQAAGAGWAAIAKELGCKVGAAQGRIQTLKTDLFEGLAKMVKPDGSRRFTATQMDDLIDRSIPPLKRTGGGRSSDKASVVDSLIAGLNLDLNDEVEAPEAPEAPAENQLA